MQQEADFASISGTLTIPAGQISAQIPVLVIDDQTFEPDETFFLNLSNPTNVTIGDSQAQATIVNNDPIPTVDVNDPFIGAEGNSGPTPVLFFVRLSNPTTQTVTLNFATLDDSATAGSDYTAVSGSLTFAPGETDKTVAVIINGDTVDETPERFFLDISNVQNASIGKGRGNGIIFDDDGPTISINDVSITEGNSGTSLATFTLTLSAASVEGISVRAITAPGTATAFSDYNSINANLTIPAGTVTRTFNITIIGDTNLEPDETFFVNLSSPFNATIADNQGIGTIVDDDGLRLILEESASDPQQAAAFDSLLLVRDPFRVRSLANWWLSLLADQNTRVTLFASNLQLNQGEPASAVTVNLVDGNNQSFDVPAEDVRAVAGVGFTQVVFRLPDNLAPGVCKVAIKANGQTSNSGNIRIVQ
jgi:Calx-beta domain